MPPITTSIQQTFTEGPGQCNKQVKVGMEKRGYVANLTSSEGYLAGLTNTVPK